MLRAVLTWEQCVNVLTPGVAHYMGKEFPDVSAQMAEFALFRVRPEEAEAEWAPGYYRLETDIAKLSAIIEALPQCEKCHEPILFGGVE
jgi:hypothetical protein